jgi:hypothetical protein
MIAFARRDRMNRGPVIRGLLALSVLGFGLIAGVVGVAAGGRMCIANQAVAWTIMIGLAAVVAGPVWLVLPAAIERQPEKPVATAGVPLKSRAVCSRESMSWMA